MTDSVMTELIHDTHNNIHNVDWDVKISESSNWISSLPISTFLCQTCCILVCYIYNEIWDLPIMKSCIEMIVSRRLSPHMKQEIISYFFSFAHKYFLHILPFINKRFDNFPNTIPRHLIWPNMLYIFNWYLTDTAQNK